MAGPFDDLIPQAAPQQGAGMFDDLIPKQPAPARPPVEASMVSTMRPPGMPADVQSGPAPTFGGYQNPVTQAVGEGVKYYLDALRNAPASAGHVIGQTVNALAHPIDTAHAIGSVLQGLGSKLTATPDGAYVPDSTGGGVYLPPESASASAARAKVEAPVNALATDYGNRYGSVPKILETFRTDPIGAALDASTLLGGVEAAGARIPGVVGKVAETAGDIGRAVDPLTTAGNATKAAASAVPPVAGHVLGFTSGAGQDAVRTAIDAGKQGGDAGKAFTENMRGDVPVTDIVDRAKAAVADMRQERADAYKTGMAKLGNDKTVLDFQPIEDATNKANQIGSYKGVVVNRSAGDVVGKINDIVSEWKGLDPNEFHTPEGLDALKRTIGDLRDSTEQGTPARLAADRVYNAVKGEIESQAPDYAATMDAYSKASDKLKEALRTFSLGERATGSTSAGKLQSAMRSGATQSFLARSQLLRDLAEHDPTLPAAIAGQSLNALAPRGVIGRGGLMALGGSLLAHPGNVIMLPAMMPRVVGEAAYGAGRAAGAGSDVLNAIHAPAIARNAQRLSYQSGRVNALAGQQSQP
jgi:hypothetical protein